MYYVIIGEDSPDSLGKRLEARPAHLERIQSLVDEGRLLVAGPMPAVDSEDPGPAGFTGSVIIGEFASLDAARRWAAEDPYVLTGVFQSVSVKPFKRVLP
ncbi:MAG: YciI family protein [Congregibacter sp.]